MLCSVVLLLLLCMPLDVGLLRSLDLRNPLHSPEVGNGCRVAGVGVPRGISYAKLFVGRQIMRMFSDLDIS